MNMELSSKEIKKYEKYSVAELKKKAQVAFNKFIRERDRDEPCISCGKARVEQAGHFYSAGHHNALRFNEDNVHGQCKRCNYFLSGNLIGYAKGLDKKIGKERAQALDMLASSQRVCKWDRFSLINIILKYK